MTKGILIGNGFTSQLIENYSNSAMRLSFSKLKKELLQEINKSFEPFRVYITEKNCDETIAENIIDQLVFMNFENPKLVYELYFLHFGLINEIMNSELSSIESILKVVNLFQLINRFDIDVEKEVIKTANIIYYNSGKYGLFDTKLSEYRSISDFFKEFKCIFTTNYDLILDDICKDEDKVYHLHGSFLHPHKNLKENNRLNSESACLVWGIHGEKKLAELKQGFSWSNFRWDAVRFGESLLHDYLMKLENEQFSEFHIFGYSCENDQHINDSIIRNMSINHIYYYCNPNYINDSNYIANITDKFLGSNAEIVFKSWDEIWSHVM